MTNDRSTDDADDEYWQRVRDADDVTEPPRHDDANVKTDPDEVREWAEQRNAVPVTDDLNAGGPGAYALRHENVVEGGAHERVSWGDFAASFRDENMAFHHADEDDEAGTHRFVRRSDAEGRAGDERADAGEHEGRADEARSDEPHPGEADPDIGAEGTESGRTDAAADRGADEGTVVGDREGGVESGTNADAGRAGTDARGTETETPSDTDVLADVSEGDAVVDDRGETVGIVTAVESGTVYVDPDPGLTEKLAAKLGWVDRDDAEYTIAAADVASAEGGDVRLER